MSKDNKEKVSNKKENNVSKQIQKPIEMVVDELENGIIDLIKESKLPPFITSMILENLSTNYKDIKKEYLKQAKGNYEAQLK